MPEMRRRLADGAKSTRARVAFVEVMLAPLALASCASTAVTTPSSSSSGSACAWPSSVGIETQNTTFPDSDADYWVQPLVGTSTTRVVISGTYPDARYSL